MKQVLITILLLFLLIGCDGIEDGVVDPADVGFIVEKISAPSELSYTDDDTQVF